MLPNELSIFLGQNDGVVFHFENGEVRDCTFYNSKEVQLKSFSISSYEYWLNGPLEEDPEEEIEYQGYDLIKSSESGYEVEGILIYFPELKKFGSHDCDHHRIILYDETSWHNISKELEIYVNGQWYPENVAHEDLNPWLSSG